MDTFYSGSIIEPRTTSNQINKKPSLPYIIVIIVEAFIILALITVLIIFLVGGFNADGFDDSDNSNYEGENIVYDLNEADASVLMYAYAATNNATLQERPFPATFCESLKEIYNGIPSDSYSMDNPCVNGSIKLFSLNSTDSNLIMSGIINLGVVVGDRAYEYNIFSDFSAVSSMIDTDTIPTATVITLNVGS